MKKLLFLLTSLYCSSAYTMVWQTDEYIGLRAPYRLLCSGVKLVLREDMPYDPAAIECIGYKYNPAAKNKREERGRCLLSEFPAEGLKFDCPSYKGKIYYQLVFVAKNNGTRDHVIDPAEIIEKTITIPAKLCRTVSLPYKPLNLYQTVTTGEKVGLTVLFLIMASNFIESESRRQAQKRLRQAELLTTIGIDISEKNRLQARIEKAKKTISSSYTGAKNQQDAMVNFLVREINCAQSKRVKETSSEWKDHFTATVYAASELLYEAQKIKLKDVMEKQRGRIKNRESGHVPFTHTKSKYERKLSTARSNNNNMPEAIQYQAQIDVLTEMYNNEGVGTLFGDESSVITKN